ncbi:MAG: Bicarbonate transport ATP-binding protein CmpD [Firmicutes bacterium ADurb.Bin300]|nr:MAG: Bicarbonate transport ATP-binding protein CmpD [Firmicutes bacterium ADurb.Bin300]HOD02522.1 ATP-binding cassette domain-containing protein [Clostridiales bacterium]
MISLDKVSVSFAGKQILKNFSITFNDGEFVCLLGASGCGKTTILRLASGLSLPDSGEIMRDESLRQSFVFQENRLLPWYDALGNILAIANDRERAQYYLREIGLGEDMHKFPNELSGGMKRRLSIARALAFGGDVFFLDEPLRELDKKTALLVHDLLKKELKGKTVIMVTHIPEQASLLADRTITLG